MKSNAHLIWGKYFKKRGATQSDPAAAVANASDEQLGSCTPPSAEGREVPGETCHNRQECGQTRVAAPAFAHGHSVRRGLVIGDRRGHHGRRICCELHNANRVVGLLSLNNETARLLLVLSGEPQLMFQGAQVLR